MKAKLLKQDEAWLLLLYNSLEEVIDRFYITGFEIESESMWVVGCSSAITEVEKEVSH